MILVGDDLYIMGAAQQHGVTDRAFFIVYNLFTRITALPFQCQQIFLF